MLVQLYSCIEILRLLLHRAFSQVNEVFVDVLTSHQPLRIPLSLLHPPQATPVNGGQTPVNAGQTSADGSSNSPAALSWRTVYFGLSTASIVRDMTLDQVAQTFNKGFIGVRSFDRITGERFGVRSNFSD